LLVFPVLFEEKPRLLFARLNARRAFQEQLRTARRMKSRQLKAGTGARGGRLHGRNNLTLAPTASRRALNP